MSALRGFWKKGKTQKTHFFKGGRILVFLNDTENSQISYILSFWREGSHLNVMNVLRKDGTFVSLVV